MGFFDLFKQSNINQGIEEYKNCSMARSAGTTRKIPKTCIRTVGRRYLPASGR